MDDIDQHIAAIERHTLKTGLEDLLAVADLLRQAARREVESDEPTESFAEQVGGIAALMGDKACNLLNLVPSNVSASGERYYNRGELLDAMEAATKWVTHDPEYADVLQPPIFNDLMDWHASLTKATA